MNLAPCVERAIDARRELVSRLAAEGTDAYRVFHGVAEGRPGLTIDRYGELVLAQTFREPLDGKELVELKRIVLEHFGDAAAFVCNHRGDAERRAEVRASHELPSPRELSPHELSPHEVSPHELSPHELSIRTVRASVSLPPEGATREFTYREFGVKHALRARHRGQDPWLFLDLRAGRRRLRELAPQTSVLNLFAYTCGAGLAALSAGASEVWNVDFAKSSLAVGRRDLELNGWEPDRMRFVQEDCIPILRQLAGLPLKGRGAERPVVQVEPRTFDIVFLDPPAWSAGPFGAVDVERDYQGLFKPALLVTRDGGTVIATHHVARVELDLWLRDLERCAVKAGRPLREIEVVTPESDFPSFDGKSPLKIAVCRL